MREFGVEIEFISPVNGEQAASVIEGARYVEEKNLVHRVEDF